ncbi:uncharacterized protein UHOD_11591 [Ustilago sp. UG-2017b]|nr:uncharacterized protein UHOD_11591 [Ustilago sp. UG-2017b]
MDISRPPINAWYGFVERARTMASNVATTLSQQARKREMQRNDTLQELVRIDIRHGDQNRARFLGLLAVLRQIDIGQASETIAKLQTLHELNMLWPTAWIIPQLESRSFAALPPLHDDQALFMPKARDPLTEEAGSVLLSSIQCQISSATRHACEAPFTVDELCSVLTRSQEMSALGLDGISYPLFHILRTTALEKLCALGNALLRGHHLPDGELMLQGVLLPKKGDLSLLQNYRPLSIADVSFCLLGGVILKHLQAAAQDVISLSQTGLILGRHSASNVVTLYLLQHTVQSGKVVGLLWILNLDQQKVYNRVQHDWLLDCLQAYGFGPRFLAYIQGDPMSCLLYNFSSQLMLDYVKYHHHAGTKLNWDTSNPMFLSSLAFADDILLVVNNRHNLAKFLNALDLYEMASNAQVNKEKSQAFFFARDQSLANDGLEDDIPYPILGDSQAEIVHLGYLFHLNGGIPHITIK